MDDYKKYYYAAVPYAKNTDYGEWVKLYVVKYHDDDDNK